MKISAAEETQKSSVGVVGLGKLGQAITHMFCENPFVDSIYLYSTSRNKLDALSRDHPYKIKPYLFRELESLGYESRPPDIIVITTDACRLDESKLRGRLKRSEYLAPNIGLSDMIGTAVIGYPGFIFNFMNPMEEITYNLALRSKKDPYTVGGAQHIDTWRIRNMCLSRLLEGNPKMYSLSEEQLKQGIQNAWVIGAHNDRFMIPVLDSATYFGTPLLPLLMRLSSNFLENIENIVNACTGPEKEKLKKYAANIVDSLKRDEVSSFSDFTEKFIKEMLVASGIDVVREEQYVQMMREELTQTGPARVSALGDATYHGVQTMQELFNDFVKGGSSTTMLTCLRKNKKSRCIYIANRVRFEKGKNRALPDLLELSDDNSIKYSNCFDDIEESLNRKRREDMIHGYIEDNLETIFSMPKERIPEISLERRVEEKRLGLRTTVLNKYWFDSDTVFFTAGGKKVFGIDPNASATPFFELEFPVNVYCVRHTERGGEENLFVGADGALFVLSYPDFEVKQVYEINAGEEVRDIGFTGAGFVAACDCAGILGAKHGETRLKKYVRVGNEGRIKSVKVIQDHNLEAILVPERKLYLVTPEDYNSCSEFQGGESDLRSVTVSTDISLPCVYGAGKKVSCWNLRNKRLECMTELLGNDMGAAIDFFKCGNKPYIARGDQNSAEVTVLNAADLLHQPDFFRNRNKSTDPIRYLRSFKSNNMDWLAVAYTGRKSSSMPESPRIEILSLGSKSLMAIISGPSLAEIDYFCVAKTSSRPNDNYYDLRSRC